MKAYHLNFSQQLPVSLKEAWDFFSSLMNLAQITPEEMALTVTSAQTPMQKDVSGYDHYI